MEEYKVYDGDHPVGSGRQIIYRFENGYGASVIRFSIPIPEIGLVSASYGAEDGLWELAVAKFHGVTPRDFDIVYDTGLTEDVIGYLSDADVEDYLRRIKELS